MFSAKFQKVDELRIRIRDDDVDVDVEVEVDVEVDVPPPPPPPGELETASVNPGWNSRPYRSTSNVSVLC